MSAGYYSDAPTGALALPHDFDPLSGGLTQDGQAFETATGKICERFLSVHIQTTARARGSATEMIAAHDDALPTGALALPHGVVPHLGSLRQNGQPAELMASDIICGSRHAANLTSQTANVNVSLPSLDAILKNWEVISAHLHRATVRTGCYEPIDLLQMAFAGQAGIWICEVDGKIRAAFVTVVQVFPRRRILEIVAGGGGGMKYWIEPLKAAIDNHARELGCSHCGSTGRPGWLRAWGAEPTGDIQMVRDVAGVAR
jgi:hypothetical protein